MQSEPARESHRSTLAVAYFVLAILGLIGTWYFNISYFTGGGGGYVGDWFANDAASSAAVDLIIMAITGCAFMAVQIRRHGLPGWMWALLPLSFAIAIAFTFPLFLALRELALRRRDHPNPPEGAG